MYKIAIVDDNETWCFVMSLRLQQQGYDVSTFTSAQAFLCETDRFDLVLIDFSLPTPRYQCDMDGPEVICKVKHQLESPPLLVLISSFFTQNLLKNAADLCPEADAVMAKEIDAQEIISQIRQLLEAKKQLKQKHFKSDLSDLPIEAETSIHS